MTTTDAPDGVASDRSTTAPVLASYAAGSLGTGAFGTLPGLVLAYYLTDSIGVAAAVATVLVLVPKVIDVLAYPLIGAVSDRASHRTGYRTGLMLFGALALPLLFVATFAAPTGWSTGASGVWVMGFFLLASIAYSCFQVPYLALPAELTDDAAARVTILAWRVAVLAAAILLTGGGGPAIRDAAGGGPGGYLLMAVGVSALMLVGMLWATFVAGRRTVTRADAPAGGLAHEYRDGLDALRVTRPFRLLVGVFCLQAVATAVMLAGGQYVATYILGDETALTGLFLALVGPALLVMPLWTRLAHARGKVAALGTSTALFTAAALLLIPAGLAPGAWVHLPVALAGVAYAGMQALPMSMLPDCTDLDRELGGRRRSGAMSGLWTASETGAMALGPAVVLTLLAIGGFRSGGVADQPGTAHWAIVLAFSLVPAILAGASLLMIRSLGRSYDRWTERT
ncbi:MFS transporter [Dietzia sp. ANT_WB102]|uniref:MFS transporter n=1 Tax=Dietzia sp. ANT_WB102 TaxID=2597345 RepID=UPI0011EE32D2|nr:MFS transporter [Dietzia sp. ANT_WB102]KAA0919692.1 MFS transporter [Dietzia sp. ANT_WB102]